MEQDAYNVLESIMQDMQDTKTEPCGIPTAEHTPHVLVLQIFGNLAE